jgi:hypothetical protein
LEVRRRGDGGGGTAFSTFPSLPLPNPPPTMTQTLENSHIVSKGELEPRLLNQIWKRIWSNSEKPFNNLSFKGSFPTTEKEDDK